MKKTKIIATVGPVTESPEQLKAIYNAWVNVIRFNFSHAQHENVAKIIERINALNESWETKLAILLDTKGPEIRTWDVSEKINYKKWDKFKIVVNQNNIDTPTTLFCDYEYLIEDMNIGDIVRIDSWLFDVLVTEKQNDYLLVEAMNDALIGSRRHVNLPWVKLRLPWITDKDKEDILFGIQQNFNFIAASFIRNKENIFEIREFLKSYGAEHIKIISKIENQEAIENLDEIIEHSDWVMVARWDLGIEVPIEKLPIYQKIIVKKCRALGKFVIIATHLLETMIDNPYPTRAEVSDIFNSVLQKADATMLSWETTIGKYPVKSVEMMRSVIDQAEANIVYTHDTFSDNGLTDRDIEKKLLLKSAIEIGEQLQAKAILVFTKSWLLARLASAFRPNLPIYAFTNSKASQYYMTSLFGISPQYLEFTQYPGNTLDNAIEILVKKWKLSKDDKVIAVTDLTRGSNEIPVMEIIYVKDFLN